MKWRPTRDGERMTALKIAGDRCRIEDLVPGDVFRMVTPAGDLVHPITQEPDASVVAVAAAAPFKNDPLGSTGQTYGYGVEIDVYDTFDAFLAERAN
jgi:hypothetical protein